MAVEKMHIIELVGNISQFDLTTKILVMMKNFQPVDALQQFNASNFYLATEEENLQALLNIPYIKPYRAKESYSKYSKEIKELKREKDRLTNGKADSAKLIWEDEEIFRKIDGLYKQYKAFKDELSDKISKKAEYEKIAQGLEFLSQVDVKIEQLNDLNNFSWAVYRISRENSEKLKRNYENIPAAITTIYSDKEYKIVMTFTPKILSNEAEKIFNSVSGEEIPMTKDLTGTPLEASIKLRKEIYSLEASTKEIQNEIDRFLQSNGSDIEALATSLNLIEGAEEVKGKSATTNEFFYLSGWVPGSELEGFKNVINKVDDKVLLIDKSAESLEGSSLVPPTKLKNNKLVRPFESMVRMYGTPAYGEIDPTAFLSISYMLLFGAMFGDLGQGFIMALAGLYLDKKMRRVNLGGVLERLGISSMIFGILYGSFFGFETVIPALLVRPMEDIMAVLIGAVAVGCILLITGYIIGLINAYRRRDIEAGLFGRDGLAGLLFFVTVLLLVLLIYTGKNPGPIALWVFILVALLVVILLKEPLANLVAKKRPLFNHSPGEYFVEAVFEIIETLLSMFSNTLSFIRVGAFAINHVGLFLAFEALAHMVNNGLGSTLIYVLGNIVILGLEGLIVFIQGLRLEYYELFSKYYRGSGVPFTPIKVDEGINMNLLKENFNIL